MQLSTQGFADGFLNGFRTMADYQSQQKANDRADRAMNLQEQEAKDSKEYREKTWDHAIQREGVADSRYQDETKYNRGRQDKIDGLNEKQTLASISNQNAQTGIAKARLDIDKQQATQQKQLTDFAFQEKQRQLWAEENSGLLLGGWKNISAGQPLTEQQAAALNDQRAGAMNINKYADKTYVSAAAGLKSSVTNIMANYKPDQFHSQEFYNQLNSPEIKQQMDVVFRDEVKKGVGYIDDSGKKIIDKKFAGIVPMKDGSLALEVTPVYEDGTSGEAKPVTVNRSNDPNDQVKTFSPADIVGVINTRANMANAVKNPDTLLQDIGVVQGPDRKGYAKSVSDIDSDTQKNISQILRNASNDPMVNKEEVKQQILDERTAGEARKSEYKNLYGLGDVTSSRGGGGKQISDTPAKLLTEWAGSDKSKQQYINQLVSSGRITLNNADTVLIDQQYQAYQNELKNQSLEQAALSHKPK